MFLLSTRDILFPQIVIYLDLVISSIQILSIRHEKTQFSFLICCYWFRTDECCSKLANFPITLLLPWKLYTLWKYIGHGLFFSATNTNWFLRSLSENPADRSLTHCWTVTGVEGGQVNQGVSASRRLCLQDFRPWQEIGQSHHIHHVLAHNFIIHFNAAFLLPQGVHQIRKFSRGTSQLFLNLYGTSK